MAGPDQTTNPEDTSAEFWKEGAAISFDLVQGTKYELVARTGANGAKVFVKVGGTATDVVIGSVDIVQAYRYGTSDQVMTQTAGLAGALGGGWAGGAVTGAALGGIFGPPGAIIGAVGGAAFGSFIGENGAEYAATGLLNWSKDPEHSSAYNPRSTAFWDEAIKDVQDSNAPPAVKAEMLRDLTMARGNPAYRQEIGERYGLVDPLCFPAHTPIAISYTQTKPISDIRVGDTVLAFDPAADLGRGALVPRKVVRLYRNTTDEWVKLTWVEGGKTQDLVTTPGHHFLDRFGQFPTIEAMLQDGKTTVVLASGELTEVTAERIRYNAETAHLFEQAQVQGIVASNAAVKFIWCMTR